MKRATSRFIQPISPSRLGHALRNSHYAEPDAARVAAPGLRRPPRLESGSWPFAVPRPRYRRHRPENRKNLLCRQTRSSNPHRPLAHQPTANERFCRRPLSPYLLEIPEKERGTQAHGHLWSVWFPLAHQDRDYRQRLLRLSIARNQHGYSSRSLNRSRNADPAIRQLDRNMVALPRHNCRVTDRRENAARIRRQARILMHDCEIFRSKHGNANS